MIESLRVGRTLAAVARALREEEGWIVGGSAGLALRGVSLPSPPNDLDLYADEADFGRLFERLRRYAVDEPALSVTDMYRSTLVHFALDGVAVELVGGFVVAARGCRYATEVRSLLLPYAGHMAVEPGLTAPVVPLAHELWFNALRGRRDRIQSIIEHLRPEDMGVAAELERRNGLPPEAVAAVRGWIKERKAGELP